MTRTQVTKPITMEGRQVLTVETTATKIWTRLRREEASRIFLAARCLCLVSLVELQCRHPSPSLNSSKASVRIHSQATTWEEAQRAYPIGLPTHSLEVTTSSNNSSPLQQPLVTSSETASPRSLQLRRLQVVPPHLSMSEAD